MSDAAGIPTERLDWLARYTDKVAEKAEGMPDAKNSAEIARANREIAATCRALIAVREALNLPLDDTKVCRRIAALVGGGAGGGR